MDRLGWLKERATGVLLHPSSLHGYQGIGVLGASAREFVDFLKESEVRYWQMLPLGPTGYGDSPYSSYSAFAGNPYLIDLQPLLEFGLLKSEELEVLRGLSVDKVDFTALQKIKWPLLRLAHKRFVEEKRSYLPNYGMLADFLVGEREWLEPYAAYMGLKERFGGTFWGDWPRDCQSVDASRKSTFWNETAQSRLAHAFFQYLFFGQWRSLKEYANKQGIEIIGDAPIFVAHDSADTWAAPHLFQMDAGAQPEFVAGVPPDYFSKTGQRWGNPLYDWEEMSKDGYDWWIRRLKANFTFFDVVRLDHFRGFYNYWKIPAGAEDARSGTWADGPQDALFEAIEKKIPQARLIAEDLGEIDDGVRNFRDRLGLPGMAILQFAFGSGSDNFYLPHNVDRNSVLYPGTHDNNTSLGWYQNATPEEQDHVRRYLRVSGEDISWDLIRAAYTSLSNLIILPLQDLLSLDESARMNVPGDELGNWQWRMTGDHFLYLRDSSPYLRELATLYGRG